jgi:RNA polymerase sigma factor (sigma-70 family)
MTDRDAVDKLLQFVRQSPVIDRTVCDRILMSLWLQELARRTATWILSRNNAPFNWRDDVAQRAMLTLEEAFLAGVDPKFDITSVDAFARSVRKLIVQHCRRAARAMVAEYDHPSLLTDPTIEEPREALDKLLDLRAAIESMTEPQRSVLALRCRGLSFRRIARQLNLRPWKVYHLYHLGKDELCRRLRKT